MRGFIKFWFGAAALILFGFLAAIMSGIFPEVINSYGSQTQLIIMAMIPIMAFALLWSMFS